MKKIVISNCWSYYNKGDAAILKGTIDLINDIVEDDKKYTCIAFNPKSFNDHIKEFGNNVEFKYMPSLLPNYGFLIKIYYGLYMSHNKIIKDLIGLFYIYIKLIFLEIMRKIDKKLNEILIKIDESDLFIAIGGNYLWSHAGLFIHLLPIIYAKNKEKKIILLGHSIGPFDDAFFHRYMTFILNHVDYILLREDISKKYLLNELNISNHNIDVIGDLAIYLSKKVQYQGIKKNKCIGLTIRQSLYNKPLLYKKYLKTIIDVCVNLANQNYSIYIMPFSYETHNEDDTLISKFLYKRIYKNIGDKVHLIDIKESSPTKILEIFKSINFSFFIGTRLHSSLFASIMNVPSINISYQHFKSYGIYNQLNMNNYVIKIEDVAYENITNMINSLLINMNNERDKINYNINRITKATRFKTKKILLNLLKK